MRDRPIALPRYIAARYVSVGKRSQLVSFMSSIAIAGLTLGVAILITVLAVMNGFDRELRVNILGLVPHITVRANGNLSAAQWQEISAGIQSREAVVAVNPVIEVSGVAAGVGGSRGVAITGLDAASASAMASFDRFMVAGEIAGLNRDRWSVVLGHGLAARLGVGPGDEIDLFSTSVSLNPLTLLPTFRSFRVVGVFRVGTQELDNDLVIVNLAAARSLFRLRSLHNALHVDTRDVLQAAAVADSLERELPASVSVSDWTRQFGSIYENIRYSRSIISFMLWLLVGVAAFNLVVSLVMIVRDKTGDIAILRTLGASPELIRRIFVWQGLLIALIGTGFGLVLGIVGALQISNLARLIERIFSIQILSAEVYPIDFLPSQLHWFDLLSVSGGVLLLALLATLLPARRAAAIQPAAALRAD